MHGFAKKGSQMGSAQPQDPALCPSDQPQACTGLSELKDGEAGASVRELRSGMSKIPSGVSSQGMRGGEMI